MSEHSRSGFALRDVVANVPIVLGRRSAGVALVAAVAAAATAGCGSGGGQEAEGEAPTTATTVNEEAAVMEAYEAGWDALVAALAAPEGPHPVLRERISGEALEDVTGHLQGMAESGEYLVGPVPDLMPEVTELSESEATVEDCVIEEEMVHFGPGGSELGRFTEDPYRVRAGMVKEADGTWRQSTFDEVGPCER